MLLAITWTSQKIKDLLSEVELLRIRDNKNGWVRSQIIIQNDVAWLVSTEDIYISFWTDAIVGQSIRVPIDSLISFDEVDILDINIVSKTWNNNVIIEFN